MDEIRAFELLKKLAFTRMSGTEEEYTAAKMLAAEAESIGVSCEIEPFTVQDGEVDRAELEVLEPFQAKYEVTGMRRSLDTGDEGIEAVRHVMGYADSSGDQEAAITVFGRVRVFRSFFDILDGNEALQVTFFIDKG